MISILFVSALIIIKINANFQGSFWHICDIHLNNSHKSDDNKRFGNYIEDSTFALVQSAYKQMKDVHPNPDFIIVNGDNAYHGQLDNAQFINSMNNTSRELLLHFPLTRILPSLGNHDVNPANLIDINSTWCKNLFEFWKIFFENATASDIETFKKGCFYSHFIETQKSKLLVVVLNTLLWYKVNKFVETVEDPLQQFLWLENKLINARKNMTKVFLVAHVPPGASEYSPQKITHLHPQFNKRLLKIMQDYADIIDAGFFAHQHTDAFKIVYNSENKPIVPLLLSPSVSPYKLWNLGSINPSVRLYLWNGTSAQSKYLQYHTHLPTELNDMQNISLKWTLEYESTDLLSSLSAESLDKLISDLSRSNSIYFNSFFTYHLSGQPHDNETCSVNSLCRCRIVCGMKNIDYSKLKSCLKTCQIQKVYEWAWILVPVTLSILIVILLIYIIFKSYIFKRRSQPRYASF